MTTTVRRMDHDAARVDEFRVLVDRLWHCGEKKVDAAESGLSALDSHDQVVSLTVVTDIDYPRIPTARAWYAERMST